MFRVASDNYVVTQEKCHACGEVAKLIGVRGIIQEVEYESNDAPVIGSQDFIIAPMCFSCWRKNTDGLQNHPAGQIAYKDAMHIFDRTPQEMDVLDVPDILSKIGKRVQSIGAKNKFSLIMATRKEDEICSFCEKKEVVVQVHIDLLNPENGKKVDVVNFPPGCWQCWSEDSINEMKKLKEDKKENPITPMVVQLVGILFKKPIV